MHTCCHERGSALIAAVLLIVILSMVGTVSLTLAVQEIESSNAMRELAVARHLAEAGSNLVMSWFHDPGTVPVSLVSRTGRNPFLKQQESADLGASYFSAEGRSQFLGTPDRPDVSLDAAEPEHDRLLNDPHSGWFRSLHGLGRILRLKVYGPAFPGLLCTVDVTARTGATARTVSLQFGARSVPPLRVAVQSEVGDGRLRGPDDAPVWVHWGDMRWGGDAMLGERQRFPIKTALAPVTGQSYANMPRPEDRWMEAWVGGAAGLSGSPGGVRELPPNVHARQDPFPGLRMDRWEYETMKKQALRYGTYYARDRDGLLYRNGLIVPGLGLTATEALRSAEVGDHHGLVFIDTLDGRPPTPDNLGVVVVESEYVEGIILVNANVVLKPKGDGKPIPALSPPQEGSLSIMSRIPVQLTGINLQGVLYAAGDIMVMRPTRIFGAVVAEGRVGKLAPSSTGSAPLEVWYNYDLRRGIFRGLPAVYPVPGVRHRAA